MKQLSFAKILALGALVAFVGSANAVYAQSTTALAPPVSTSDAASTDSNVYNWRDVPSNQQIPITRAVFDQGGYQLYCTTGETIVVPFVNNNLYVMKFGQTNSGMYFVNDGSTPTLYVPQNGYLENSAAQGARWYPFAANYAYTEPVYIGPAPNWNAFITMGWYPGMIDYGGYWSLHPYGFGVSFSPMPGLAISIFGNTYHGWGDYHSFFVANPTRAIVLRNGPVFGHYNVPRRGFGAFPESGRAVTTHRPFGDAKPSGTWDGDHRGGDGRFGGWSHGGGHDGEFGGDHGGDHGR